MKSLVRTSQDPRGVRALSRGSELASRLSRLPRGGGGQLEGGRARESRQEGVLHPRAQDRESVRHHYDMGNDFFRLYLDTRMVYSCAYFKEGNEPIDEAQDGMSPAQDNSPR